MYDVLSKMSNTFVISGMPTSVAWLDLDFLVGLAALVWTDDRFEVGLLFNGFAAHTRNMLLL